MYFVNHTMCNLINIQVYKGYTIKLTVFMYFVNHTMCKYKSKGDMIHLTVCILLVIQCVIL